MTQQEHIQPKITVLSEENIQQVHQDALAVLAQSGVKVESDRALKMLAKRQGMVVSGDRVTFDPEIVEWAIQAAPSHFDIYNRLGEHAFQFGSGRTRFGIGSTTLHYQDPVSGKTTPFHRKHMVEMTRLGNILPIYDTVSTIGIIQDIHPNVADLYATLEMVANTTKPIMILVSEDKLFSPTLDMLEHLTGDMGEKPHVITYVNPITPLVINQGTIDKMYASIARDMPIVFNSFGLSGVTTPMTPAGVLVTLIAEQLAGLTLSQIIKEGAALSLGFLPSYMDMQSMVNFYDPVSHVVNLAGAEMLDHYDIPYSGMGGGSPGWGPDFMSAGTYWMNHLPALLGKVDYIGFVGDTMSAKVFSPVNVVFAHEVITRAIKFSQGFQFDEENIGLADILEKGPGGHFLSSPLTLKYVREAYYQSPIYDNITFEEWSKLGQPDAVVRLKEYTRDLLDDLSPPDDQQEIVNKGEAFIEALS